MRTGPSNPYLKQLVAELLKHAGTAKSAMWRRVADDLQKSSRSRRVVNIAVINRFTKQNEVVVVPGKVLGTGMIDHSVTVAAFAFSAGARQQIEQAKGRCVSIQELVKQHPQGTNVRLLG